MYNIQMGGNILSSLVKMTLRTIFVTSYFASVDTWYLQFIFVFVQIRYSQESHNVLTIYICVPALGIYVYDAAIIVIMLVQRKLFTRRYGIYNNDLCITCNDREILKQTERRILRIIERRKIPNNNYVYIFFFLYHTKLI